MWQIRHGGLSCRQPARAPSGYVVSLLLPSAAPRCILPAVCVLHQTECVPADLGWTLPHLQQRQSLQRDRGRHGARTPMELRLIGYPPDNVR